MDCYVGRSHAAAACSLRVTFAVFIFAFVLILFFVAIFFVLFWLFPKKDIGSRRAIRRICVEALWAYSAHVPMVLCALGESSGGC
jgi:hypothetical protein